MSPRPRTQRLTNEPNLRTYNDQATDTIAAVTIRDVSAYMEEKAADHVWMSLMDILRLVRTIEVPPGVGADAGRDAFAQQLRQLVFT